MRILSWNIQWGRGADGVVALERTIDVLRQCDEVDAICLQEVALNVPDMPGGDCGDQPAALARAFPTWVAIFGPGMDVSGGAGGRACFGNMLLSRLPVDQVCRHMLPMPADALVPGMRRACIEAVIQTGSGPIRLMTTHLEYYSAVQRSAQIQTLRALQIEALTFETGDPKAGKESNPIFASRSRPFRAVLCGDFNFEPGSADYAALSSASSAEGLVWQDAWACLHGTQPHEPTVGLHGAEWPDRPYCCDYFWVSEELNQSVRALRVMADTDASDHQPILLELKL